MAEYIEREAVLSEIDKAFKLFEEHDDIIRLFSDVRSCAIYANAVYVAPLRHGRWVNEDFPDEQADATDPAICSECKEPAHKAEHGYAILSHYCPNCGCLMDGGSDNG